MNYLAQGYIAREWQSQNSRSDVSDSSTQAYLLFYPAVKKDQKSNNKGTANLFLNTASLQTEADRHNITPNPGR